MTKPDPVDHDVPGVPGERTGAPASRPTPSLTSVASADAGRPCPVSQPGTGGGRAVTAVPDPVHGAAPDVVLHAAPDAAPGAAQPAGPVTGPGGPGERAATGPRRRRSQLHLVLPPEPTAVAAVTDAPPPGQPWTAVWTEPATPRPSAAVDAALFAVRPDVAGLPSQLTPELASALNDARGAAGRRLAGGTVQGYAAHWRDFAAWCRQQHVGPEQASAEIVAAYLMVLAARPVRHVSTRGRGTAQAEHVVRERDHTRSAADITRALSAINRRLEATGRSRPLASSEFLRDVSRVARSEAKITQQRNVKDPLLTVHVKALIDQTYREHLEDVLDQVAVLLLASGLSVAALVALCWSHVDLTADAVRLILARPVRPGGPRELTVRARTGGACLVASLQALQAAATEQGRAGDGDPVLVRNRPGYRPGAEHRGLLHDKRWTHGGLTARLRALCARAGVGWDALVRGTPGAVRDLLCTLAQPHVQDVRDRALVLVQFACMLRRSNVAWLWWGDVHWERGGALRLHLRKQKNDQQGKGHDVTAVPGSSNRYCPRQAMRAWHELRESMAGPSAVGSQAPVFVAFTRHQTTRATTVQVAAPPLSADGVQEVLMRLVAEVGIAGNFGSHSLRAGSATQMLINGVGYRQVQEYGGWSSTDMVALYDRRHNGSGEATSAALQL